MNKEPITVVDQAGLQGLVEPSQFTKGDPSGVQVWFADRQVLVPAEMLVAQTDGTFYLPLSLAELAKRTTQGTSQTDGTMVVPVIEEELHVQKRAVETGVRVSKVVHEKQEPFELPLISEEVEIKRLPINRRIDQPVAMHREGDVLVIPVVEEVLVVQKQLLLKEEVHIITKRTTTRHSGQETLRHEELLIEPIQDSASQQNSSHDSLLEKVNKNIQD